MSNGDQLEIVLWTLLATALGSVIGAEREFRGHEAGIRTSGLVAGAAAIFGLVSTQYGAEGRVAAGVVQGIGFLGAGLILRRRSSVAGVTTAASVWLVAGIGLLVAAELWLTATLLTAAYVVLLELGGVSDWVYLKGRQLRAKKKPLRDPPERDLREPEGDRYP
ncbi:MAG: MgtC/SapB family protein [Dehalococcoidia bacterium]